MGTFDKTWWIVESLKFEKLEIWTSTKQHNIWEDILFISLFHFVHFDKNYDIWQCFHIFHIWYHLIGLCHWENMVAGSSEIINNIIVTVNNIINLHFINMYHKVTNLLYYEHWTKNWKYFYLSCKPKIFLLFYSKGSRRHSKGIYRAFGHTNGTWALEGLLDTRRALKGHSQGILRTLTIPRHSGTWALEALGYSKGTWATSDWTLSLGK